MFCFHFRRERKRKFDVKTLLKLRPSSAASSITSSPSSPAASTTTTTTATTPSNRKSTDEQTHTTAPGDKAKKETPLTATKKRQSRNKVQKTTETNEHLTTPKDVSKRDVSSEKDDNSLEVSGKRKIKKKKFWDETEAGTSNKTVRQRQQQQPQHKQLIVPVKNRRRRSVVDSGDTNFSHKDNNKVKLSSDTSSTAVNAACTTSATTEQSKENGKLKYLLFDMTSEPRLIAEKMIEGVNIPGPGVPIPIDSSRLPNGWEKRVIQRGIGITKGKWDVFIQNTNGRTFR